MTQKTYIWTLRCVLCGLSQVMLQKNALTGFIFLLGIFYNSITLGCAALCGAVVSTFTALILKEDRTQIAGGLFGFNGALVTTSLIYYVKFGTVSWAYAVFGALLSVPIVVVSSKILFRCKLPALTFPFVFTTLCFLFAARESDLLSSTNLLSSTQNISVSSVFLVGLLKGIAQIFFQDNEVTGAIFVLGLYISSRKSAVLALIGSAMGMLYGALSGASASMIGSGGLGFNPALTTIAIGALSIGQTRKSIPLYVCLSAIITVAISIAINWSLSLVSLPILTLPFVLATWLLLVIDRRVKRNKLPDSNPISLSQM